jgi:hypothetical protein
MFIIVEGDGSFIVSNVKSKTVNVYLCINQKDAKLLFKNQKNLVLEMY